MNEIVNQSRGSSTWAEIIKKYIMRMLQLNLDIERQPGFRGSGEQGIWFSSIKTKEPKKTKNLVLRHY